MCKDRLTPNPELIRKWAIDCPRQKVSPSENLAVLPNRVLGPGNSACDNVNGGNRRVLRFPNENQS